MYKTLVEPDMHFQPAEPFWSARKPKIGAVWTIRHFGKTLQVRIIDIAGNRIKLSYTHHGHPRTIQMTYGELIEMEQQITDGSLWKKLKRRWNRDLNACQRKCIVTSACCVIAGAATSCCTSSSGAAAGAIGASTGAVTHAMAPPPMAPPTDSVPAPPSLDMVRQTQDVAQRSQNAVQSSEEFLNTMSEVFIWQAVLDDDDYECECECADAANGAECDPTCDE